MASSALQKHPHLAPQLSHLVGERPSGLRDADPSDRRAWVYLSDASGTRLVPPPTGLAGEESHASTPGQG